MPRATCVNHYLGAWISARQLRQIDVAEAVGIDAGQINRWCKKRRAMPLKKAKVIATFLGITLEQLISADPQDCPELWGPVQAAEAPAGRVHAYSLVEAQARVIADAARQASVMERTLRDQSLALLELASTLQRAGVAIS